MPVDRLKVVARFDDEPLHIADLGIRNGQVFFQYTADALACERSFSPVHLQPNTQVQSFKPGALPPSFMGLPGLLADALPDSWGRALFRRELARNNTSTRGMTALDILSFIGESGLGALSFYPLALREGSQNAPITMDAILTEVNHAQTTTSTLGSEFLAAALPSGGARPKVLLQKSGDKLYFSRGALGEPGESWLLKFPDKNDHPEAGLQEYHYHQLAKKAGIRVPEAAVWGERYFAVKRFDRCGDTRQHVHSLSGILHREFTDFSLSYDDFFTLTRQLTQSVDETLEAFRRAIFNRVFENMDDHAKNHAFTMDHTGKWRLSPAYDLTHSTILGIHPMAWLGTSIGLPATPAIVEQASALGIRKKAINECLEHVQDLRADTGLLSQKEWLDKLVP
ncbi:serine/threonine-protein kinase HipA [Alteromonadaceae bacterium Bs31]|nr:serine/threonine-protein kinase HipA [Alteromonadaceae bacterium Bs31]